VPEELTSSERQGLAELLRGSGRDPASFIAVVQGDGLVRVCGPRGTAFYPREHWLARFARHLDKSFFDAVVPPPAGPRLARRPAERTASTA